MGGYTMGVTTHAYSASSCLIKAISLGDFVRAAGVPWVALSESLEGEKKAF